MSTRASLRSGDAAVLASPSLIPMLLVCCTGGVVGQRYTFNPGDDVSASLDGGIGCDAVLYMLRATGRTVRATVMTPSWSPAPSVTHVGTGPTVSCALASGASGCADDHTIVQTVTTGGLNGSGATVSIAYDGATIIEALPIPAEPPPSLLGTVDLTGITLSTLNTTTLVFTAPTSLTVTFTTPTSVEDIAAQINAAAISGSKVHRAEISQTTTGAKNLRLYTTTGGSGVTLTIDAATSTGEAILGFTSGASNLTATGTAATLTLPKTGLKFTYVAGTYVRGDTYTAVCTGPRATINSVIAAANAAHDDYKTNPFGFLVVAQPAANATDCAALNAALATLTNSTWLPDANAPIFVTVVIGAPFHTASSTLSTNDTNIQTSDAALLSAFSASSTNFDNVATEDVYLPGSTSLRFGTFRRTAALAWGAKRAGASKLAADVADGLVPEATLLHPDGITRARDDAHQTTKLGGHQGPGFSALKATSAGMGSVKFDTGATRAGPSSRLRFCGVVGVGLEIARIVYPFIELWEGQTDRANPVTKQMADDVKKRRASDVYQKLKPTLIPDKGDPNVTDFSVVVTDPPTGTWFDNGITPVKIPYFPLGETTASTIDIVATGTVIT